MAIVRTAVLLFAYPAGGNLNLHGDASWYRNYFFGPAHGQAGYWIQQSNAAIVIDGEVFDWALVDTPNPDLSNRTATLNHAIKALENDRGVNFDDFDVIVLVLGLSAHVGSDGGSTIATSENRDHAGIVVRTGDTFDFVAHEFGHAIGVDHSYGSPAFKADEWSQPGEYGHPYCIMSARSYGGIGGSYHPPVPRDNRPEYAGLGPSINAATALARGWLRAHAHQLPGGPVDFELRSRHWLGAQPALTPQAVELHAPEGSTYVLEYRENAGWDAGQGGPVLLINAAKGSTADLAHPGTHSATFLGMIRLPVTFGGAGSVFNGPGFGVEVVDLSPGNHTARVRVVPGRAAMASVSMSVEHKLLESTVVERGNTTFVKGERLCLEGTWPYEKVERRELAVFDLICQLPSVPTDVTWSVEGITLTLPRGTLQLVDKQVQVANPKLETRTATPHVIFVPYEVEAQATGSRLRLYGNPGDQTFDLHVSATASNRVGSRRADGWTVLSGMEYRYPHAFYQRRDACLKRIRDASNRFVKHKVVLQPDLWQRISPAQQAEVQLSLEVMGSVHAQGDMRAFEELSRDLANMIGVSRVTPTVVSHQERARVTPYDGKHEVLVRPPTASN